jgi:hypothetical protein
MPNITETQRTSERRPVAEPEARRRARRPAWASLSRLARPASREHATTPPGVRTGTGDRPGYAFRLFAALGKLLPSRPLLHIISQIRTAELSSVRRERSAAASSIHSASKAHTQAASAAELPQNAKQTHTLLNSIGRSPPISFFNEIALNLFVNGLRGRRRLKS